MTQENSQSTCNGENINGEPSQNETETSADKQEPDATPDIQQCGSCSSHHFNYTASLNIRITSSAPQVTAIRATLPSTGNALAGEFITTNTSPAYATDSNDLMVVFKGSDTISIEAVGVNPPNSQLKWKIERDPSDPMTTINNGNFVLPFDTALPTLSSSSGQVTYLNPNSGGNFRLICYFDTNNNNDYDSGEELKVLRFVVVRMFVQIPVYSTTPEPCRFENTNMFFSYFPAPTVAIANNDVTTRCIVYYEGGGSDVKIGLDKIKLGVVGNVDQQTHRIDYRRGNCIDPYTGKLAFPNSNNAFRETSVVDIQDTPSGYGKGALVIAFQDKPATPIWDPANPTNQTLWSSTSGGYLFNEFVAAYSESFSNHYVSVAKGTWQIDFSGYRGEQGEWVQGGAFVNLLPLNHTTDGFIETGTATGMEVTGEYEDNVQCSQF